jgi:hypothetical protein
MMQPTKDRPGYHPQVRRKPVSVCLPRSRQVRSRLRDAWPQRHMRTTGVRRSRLSAFRGLAPSPTLPRAAQSVISSRQPDLPHLHRAEMRASHGLPLFFLYLLFYGDDRPCAAVTQILGPTAGAPSVCRQHVCDQNP